jgi:hypothetical protein
MTVPLQMTIVDLNSGHIQHVEVAERLLPVEIANGTELLIDLQTSKDAKNVSLSAGSVTVAMAQFKPGFWRARLSYFDLHNSGDRHDGLQIDVIGTHSFQVIVPVAVLHDR